MSKVKKNQEKNLSLLIVAILALAILIIGIEVVTVNHQTQEKEQDLIKSAHNKTEQQTTKKNNFYDTSNLKFTQIDLNNNIQLTNNCINGCNLKLKDSDILVIIKKNSETLEYRLDIVKDKSSLLENKPLGKSLEGSTISNYAGYKMLKMKVKSDEYYYDYALFIDEDNSKIDEIASLNANEMEFLENGVVYYYDVCRSDSKGPDKKVKAVRAPFSENPAIISSVETNFSWCN